MKTISKLAALAASVGMMASASMAQAQEIYYPTDKPIDFVQWFYGSSNEVIGVYVSYCDSSSYRAGMLSVYTDIVPLNECE